MRFSHYTKRVEESKEFKVFAKKHPKSYLCAGFFVMDFEQGKDSHQIDFMMPNGKVATFNLDDGVKMKISELPTKLKKKLGELEKESHLDTDVLKGIVQDEMKNKMVTEEIKKIIAVFQILDGEMVWNLNCIVGGMNVLQVHIADKDGNILKFEKHSLLDFIKKI